MSVRDDDREADSMSIRQSCIDCCDAELETPEDSSVKRPPYDLNFGAPDAVVVFLGTVVDTCTLLGCHVAIGKAVEIGTDKICRRDFCCEKELFNESVLLASIDVRTRDKSALWQSRIRETYSSQWHQVVIKLPISWSHGPPSEKDSDKDGKQPNREKDELLWSRHLDNLGDGTIARGPERPCGRKIGCRWPNQSGRKHNRYL